MKNFLTIIIVLTSITFFSSQQRLSINDISGDHSVFNGITVGNKTLKYDEIKGTPYEDENFKQAHIADNYEELSVRYNSYTDEVEFKKGDKVSVLPKLKDFYKIRIKTPAQTIVYLETNDDLEGYFYEIVSGKVSLYKKVKTIFKDLVPSTNSYSTNKPAEFKKQEPTYYIKIENDFIKKPKNVKNIVDFYPETKEELNSYVKDNKIKFNQDKDLEKLVKFLNQHN